MKDKLPAKLRAVTLFLCCAVLTLLGGGARAEEEVETGARAAGAHRAQHWHGSSVPQ